MSITSTHRPGAATQLASSLTRLPSLALAALLVMLCGGCASAPTEDSGVAASQSVAPAAASSPAVASPAAAPTADADDAKLTPAERQARAKQAAIQADQAAQQALQQQCSELRAEIREQQLDEQQAPDTSVSETIVQAKEAHADQRIQNLQNQYGSLDCASVVGAPSHTPVVPVSPAPGSLGPPGAQGVPSVP